MLYANTDDGSSALWVLDNNGIVVDNISIHGAERAPILAKINKHYGTSFTGWSDNEIGLRFGDSLPNWNAYEKIEMTKTMVAIHMGGEQTPMIFGEISDDYLILDAKSETEAYLVDNNGQITNGKANINPITKPDYIAKVQNLYPNVIDITCQVKQYETGDAIKDWDKYQKIS